MFVKYNNLSRGLQIKELYRNYVKRSLSCAGRRVMKLLNDSLTVVSRLIAPPTDILRGFIT